MTAPQLPKALRWTTPASGHILDITVSLGGWPELVVMIAERGRATVFTAAFGEDGVQRRLVIDAPEITTADLRRPALLRSMRDSAAWAREWARCKLAGEPEPELGDCGPAGSLREFAYGTPGRPARRKRGADYEQTIREVAAMYRERLAAGDPAPLVTIATRLGYSRRHVGRLVGQARQPRNGQPPLLGPAPRGKAGEETPVAA